MHNHIKCKWTKFLHLKAKTVILDDKARVNYLLFIRKHFKHKDTKVKRWRKLCKH